MLSKGGSIFIAEQDGQPVGCCSLTPMEDHGFEIGKMVVDPSARGLGIGMRLLRTCEDTARRAKGDRLYLESGSAQIHAIALYGRFGFSHLPPQPTPYARADVWMEKRL